MKTISVCLALVLVCASATQAKRAAPHGPAKTMKGGKRLTKTQKVALNSALRSMRRLNAAIGANLSYQQYDERFINTKVDVDEQLGNVRTGKSKSAALAALRCYQDAHDLWDAFNQDDGDACGVILRRYFTDPQVFGLDKNGNTTPRPALDKIWKIAAQKTNLAADSAVQSQ